METTTPERKKPDRYCNDGVYSNFDHVLQADVVAALDADADLCAAHRAWNFCGYVWRSTDGVWHEEVWQHKAPVEIVDGASAAEVIAAVNDRYGSD